MTTSLPFTREGELSPSPDPYKLTDTELYEVFVEQAPHSTVRRRLHTALRLHLDILCDIAGSGPVLIGGGFISHKPTPPTDVDLVYLCRDSEHLESVLTHPDALQLLTLQKGYVLHPAMFGFDRLQPVGGKVDAFLATPGRYAYWRGLWSTIKGTGQNGIPKQDRGYVEVMV
ncbi:hypothetical protein EF294_07350 [Gordonia oryzae]|uniref:Uncharacterized protein n=1 Tax=Gordonia oryzae TaxID=2487349 RepID=A0A3N4H0L7_9ACTN|nr:hypothetical protein [Gordonia oryzae]RPA64891.1 hypothetical protein EF294_07350 [Gordonia oryzae]